MFPVGGRSCQKDMSVCCETNGKSFEFLSQDQSLCFLVFSKFLNFGLETMYSTKQLQLITPRGICVSFAEYLGDVCHRQDYVGA